VLVVALAAPAPAAEVLWHGTGVVLALLPPPSDLHATRPVIVIQHGPIPGLMEKSMAMPFIAASTTLLEGLRPGDNVAFTLEDVPDALLLISIQRVPR
jgi:Cu/Ag efflux protein CusF